MTPAAPHNLTVSVVVVSRERPDDLRKCLIGLGQLYHPSFEVVVVADEPGLRVVAEMGLTGHVKTALCSEANISLARNIGIDLAAGQVVAFIDDDAVPEPTWLGRLLAPFEDSQVLASTGYVRGRNGISFQWKAAEVDRLGEDHPLSVSEAGEVFPARTGFAVKTVGTNTAFRRSALEKIGGFDPAYRFFLDETDVNLRLSKLGGLTAVVPLAQVHHGFAASVRRRHDRVPTDLSEIAASTAVFHRKHGQGEADQALRRLMAEQHKRLERHLITGALEPRDMRRLKAGARQGFRDGLNRAIDQGQVSASPPVFQAWNRPIRFGDHRFLVGGPSDRVELVAKAKALQKQGVVVTICLLERSIRFHRVGFGKDGFWWQKGGLFGRSDRQDALFKRWSMSARSTREEALVAPLRSPA